MTSLDSFTQMQQEWRQEAEQAKQLEEMLKSEQETARQLQNEHLQLCKQLNRCIKILECIQDPDNVLSPTSLLSLEKDMFHLDTSVLSPASRQSLLQMCSGQ